MTRMTSAASPRFSRLPKLPSLFALKPPPAFTALTSSNVSPIRVTTVPVTIGVTTVLAWADEATRQHRHKSPCETQSEYGAQGLRGTRPGRHCGSRGRDNRRDEREACSLNAQQPRADWADLAGLQDRRRAGDEEGHAHEIGGVSRAEL